MTLSDKIRIQGEKSHGKGKSYDDLLERQAFFNFLPLPTFQEYFLKYFGKPNNVKIKNDPLGKKRVDLGLVDIDDEQIIHGLIEVDMFNKWGATWPRNYVRFHILERKLKYFLGNSFKYLHCTFNNTRTKMRCTTRENIERCLKVHGVVEKYVPEMKIMDRFVRCPLDSNIIEFDLEGRNLFNII